MGETEGPVAGTSAARRSVLPEKLEVCMDAQVLVANDLPLDRSVLLCTLTLLRPELSVVAVPPDELDDAAHDARPTLVIGNRISEAVRAAAPSWVLLYPADRHEVIVSRHGCCTTVEDVDLEAILDIVDDSTSH